MKKNEFRKIQICELPKKIPNYRKSKESKDVLVYNWIKNWIIEGLENRTVKINELLPSKADLAYHLGVSIGTVQNAIRYIEDEGYFESKQRIGTLVKDVQSGDLKFRKLTSKREKLICELKKFIIDNNYQIGDKLPPAKKIASILSSSANTTRLALEHLSSNGIIQALTKTGAETHWTLLSIPAITEDDLALVSYESKSKTLVDKVEADLVNYISQNYKIGDKLAAHAELAQKLGVSIKTIHDAMQNLIDKGILLSRRGRYGTTIIKLPNQNAMPEELNSQNLQESAFYNYQKIEHYIKNLIREKYDIGQKLPAMDVLAKELEVSTNTIKKALQNLYQAGYVDFSRGRYGGTFVIDIPDEVNENTFKWLAVNPQYMNVYKN